MDEYNVVIDALQTKLDAIEKMQRGCDNINSSIGGGMGLMDCIRYEQMDELRQAIKREQALSYVNETPKNEHDSDDVLKRAPLVRLTDDEVESIWHGLWPWGTGDRREVNSTIIRRRAFANAIMDAIIKKNGG